MNLKSFDLDIFGELHDTIPPTPQPVNRPLCYIRKMPTVVSAYTEGVVAVHHSVTGSAQVSLAYTRTHHPCDPTPTAKGIAPYDSVIYSSEELCQ